MGGWVGGVECGDGRATCMCVPRPGEPPPPPPHPPPAHPTHQNVSGEAVGRLARFYRVPPERVLVIYDDMDLPTAQVRLRAKGGHGGHNGMKSISGECMCVCGGGAWGGGAGRSQGGGGWLVGAPTVSAGLRTPWRGKVVFRAPATPACPPLPRSPPPSAPGRQQGLSSSPHWHWAPARGRSGGGARAAGLYKGRARGD